MRLCVAYLLLLVSFTWAEVQVVKPKLHNAYGYIQNVGIPRAEAIRKAEEQPAESRIIGGLPAVVGQYPFKAGLIGDIIGLDSRSVCGGSLLSTNRVLTAAHCWNDGNIQVWKFTVVLGSATLFSGGTRVESSVVFMHPNWNAALARNDIAIIYLPKAVTISSIISPVALPTGSQENENFVGEPAIAVGFGITADGSGISLDQSLNHVRLNVITNSICSYAFPFIIQSTHLCTSGIGGTSICGGDSGGPLLATRNGLQVQAGLILSIIGLEGSGVCGGSLISANRVITAAHCWFDGVHQAWRITVVLGSTLLFSGGTRLETSVVVSHPSWLPLLARNDVAVVYLPSSVSFSNTIGPVALPSGAELNENFAGESVIASGFGITSDGGGISSDQFLSHVNLQVITNSVCSYAFPLILQSNHICTSGIGGVGTCGGDSGGPLVLTRNNRRVLIGVVSFGSALGCQANLPAAYSRVTSFIDFFNQHL